MKSTRLLAFLAIGVTSLVLSCTGGESPTGDHPPAMALVGLNAIFPLQAGEAQAGDISRIRLTVLRFANRAPLDVVVRDVEPDASESVIEFEVEVPLDDPRILVLLELISVTGTVEAVEWVGITEPITLDRGRAVDAGQVDLVRGPVDNLAVTSISIIHPGSLLEGTESSSRPTSRRIRPVPSRSCTGPAPIRQSPR